MIANDKAAKIMDITNDWHDLIFEAQSKYVFGKPLNHKLFKQCMKSAFEWFLKDKEPKYQFDRFETNLYGLIRGYSCIPAFIESRYSLKFKASLHAASILAGAVLHPETMTVDGYKLIKNDFYIGNEFKSAVYDFETGDLKDYTELVKSGFWDD